LTRAEELAVVIAAEAAAVGVALTPEAAALAGRHAAELLAWNAGANLTRVTEPRELARRHFVESFLAATLLPPATASPLTALDVGAGGGFPGLALRVLRPDVALVMLEPRRRKAAFLRHVAGLQPPPRPQVETLRLEELPPGRSFEVVTFRAVRLAAEDLLRVLAPGGRLLTFPGEEDASVEEEMAGAGLQEVGAVPLPGGRRRVVAWSP